jgi:hypothetical protein
MKHLKTFESFSYTSTEVVQEELFGFGKPKDGEWTKDINKNWELLKAGKLSKKSLEEKFVEYGEGFGYVDKNAINFASQKAPSVYKYLYKGGKAEDVIEEEFAKIHFNRCKAVKKQANGKWEDITAVGDSEGGPGGRKF